ncbi:MAG: response regulator [Acidobacteria bacterium]|nr:response regulator [Acidobacteriota bacterium]MBI3658137.1 response regulator [Acidobacteriota bacterium]
MIPETILIVDDEESVCFILGQILKRQGYGIVTATNFQAGLKALSASNIHTAILDIRLPDASGVELLKAISLQDEYIPVIIMTGRPNVSDIPDIVRGGAWDFLAKPIQPEDLLRVVERAVAKKKAVDERTQALQETTNFLNTLLNSCTNFGIIAWDREGRISAFNRGAKAMFGYSSEEVLGRKIVGEVDLFDGIDEAELKRICLSTIESGSVEWAQGCLTQNRRRFDGWLTLNPMRDDQGQAIGFLCLVKDITQLKQAEAELDEMRNKLVNSEKMGALGRMSAHVAHEIKNPLGGLKLYALTLKKKLAESVREDQRDLVDKICSGIDHLDNIVNRITKFAHPITVDRNQLRVNAVVAEALALLQDQILAKEIAVTISLDENVPVGYFDESALKSTLLNLIINAIQAVECQGTIGIKTALIPSLNAPHERARVAIEISDNGCGMSEEQLANIYEPFFTTKVQGMGWGMTYVKNVVLLHNGTIQVNSLRGMGTCVRVLLPLAA